MNIMMDTLKNSKVVRFAVIGGINTLLDFGILLLLSRVFGVPVVVANIISTSVAFVFSFIMNKKYTFKTSGSNVRRELILFIAVTLFGLWVLQNVVIWLVIPLLVAFSPQIQLLGAKLVATVVSLVWNYLMYDRVVFTHKER